MASLWSVVYWATEILLDEISQLRNVVEELLKVGVADLVRQARYQRLCLFRSLAAQAPYIAVSLGSVGCLQKMRTELRFFEQLQLILRP